VFCILAALGDGGIPSDNVASGLAAASEPRAAAVRQLQVKREC